MIKITIENPTKCYLENPSSDEIGTLRQALTYSDTSATFALKKLKENRWLRQNKPHTYELREKEDGAVHAHLVRRSPFKFDTTMY